jgi:hypothetical protein
MDIHLGGEGGLGLTVAGGDNDAAAKGHLLRPALLKLRLPAR